MGMHGRPHALLGHRAEEQHGLAVEVRFLVVGHAAEHDRRRVADRPRLVGRLTRHQGAASG